MIRISFYTLCVAAIAVFPFTLLAQSYDPILETGTKPFQSYDGDVDAINLATGNLNLHIPLVSFPQRGGKLHVNFLISYNSTTVTEYCPLSTHCYWVQSTTGSLGGNFSDQVGIVPDTGNPANLPDGTTHPLGYIDESGTTYVSFQMRSVDGSGIIVTSTSSQTGTSTTTVDRDGITYYCPPNAGPCSLTDTNGNQLTFTGGPNALTDTMGRQIPSPPSSPGNWVVPGPNGTSQTYQVTANASAIILPDLRAYSFQYTTFTLPLVPGQTTAQTISFLSKVKFPSGGSISYGYPTSLALDQCSSVYTYHAPVVSRTIDANDGTGPHTWTYGYNSSTGVTTVTDPLGGQSVNTFNGPSGNSLCFPYVTQTQQKDSHGNVLKTVNTKYSYITDQNAPWYGPLDVLPTNISTVWSNGQQSSVSITYDKDHGQTFRFGMTVNQVGIEWANQQSGYTNNPWTVTETDYGQGTSGSTLRTTSTSYLAFSNSTYFNENILNAIASEQIQNGSGTQQAFVTYSYDESKLQSSGVTEQHGAGVAYPGNQTSVHRWLSNGSAAAQSPCNVSVPNGGYVVSYAVYFDTGQLQASTDPCGFSTTYQYSAAYYGAYLTTASNALQQNMVYAYDFNTGLLTSATDPNSQPTSKQYDIMGRLIRVSYPDGGSTKYCYTDLGGATCTQASSPPYDVVTTKAISSSLNETSTIILDGLGRISQTQLNSDPDGIDYVDTTYDGLGRKSTVSNPHRTGSSTTDGITTYIYDALSRVCVVGQPDGSAVSQSSGCPTTAPVGDAFTQYSGNCATVTDEAGKSRKSCVDGIERLTGVWEDPSGLNYETDYSYDVLGNLTGVSQKGSNSGNARIRSFHYDSLSRLTSASNPESGTINYAYDADGNVITKTAPLPNQTGTATVTTTYAYDSLNRLTKWSYSDGTTPFYFNTYDVPPPWMPDLKNVIVT